MILRNLSRSQRILKIQFANCHRFYLYSTFKTKILNQFFKTINFKQPHFSIQQTSEQFENTTMEDKIQLFKQNLMYIQNIQGQMSFEHFNIIKKMILSFEKDNELKNIQKILQEFLENDEDNQNLTNIKKQIISTNKNQEKVSKYNQIRKKYSQNNYHFSLASTDKDFTKIVRFSMQFCIQEGDGQTGLKISRMLFDFLCNEIKESGGLQKDFAIMMSEIAVMEDLCGSKDNAKKAIQIMNQNMDEVIEQSTVQHIQQVGVVYSEIGDFANGKIFLEKCLKATNYEDYYLILHLLIMITHKNNPKDQQLLKYFRQVIKMNKQLGVQKSQLPGTLFQFSIILFNQGKVNECVQLNEEALVEFKKLKKQQFQETSYLNCCCKLGEIYFNYLKDKNKALKHFEEILTTLEKSIIDDKDQTYRGRALYYTSLINFKINQIQKSFDYGLKADKELSKPKHSNDLQLHLFLKGILYTASDKLNLNQSKMYQKKFQNFVKQHSKGNDSFLSSYYSTIAANQERKGQYKEAKQNYQVALYLILQLVKQKPQESDQSQMISVLKQKISELKNY